jgi:hypothetical protein
MFLAFQYGFLYVLSFATIAIMFATATALVVSLVMIACRIIWRLLGLPSRMYDEFTVVPTDGLITDASLERLK